MLMILCVRIMMNLAVTGMPEGTTKRPHYDSSMCALHSE